MRREKQETPTRSKKNDEDIADEVLEFVRAIDDYKRNHNKPFPTWTEILRIFLDLGYRKGGRGTTNAKTTKKKRSR